MPVKREPSEPQGFIKPNGVGIPALQDGEEVKSKGDGIRFDPMEGREDTVRLFRLLLETAKCADIPVRFAGGSGGLRQGD